MQKINYGKKFEEQVRKSLDEVTGCIVERIPDQMSGFSGSSNVSDFIVYRRPMLLYLECKCTYDNTLNFHNITDNQWKGMLERAKTYGVVAGVIMWFIDLDDTVFVPIQTLQQMKDDGLKSVNAKNFDAMKYQAYLLEGQKKRVFFDYNMAKLLDELERAYV